MTKATVIAPDAKLKDVIINRLQELGHPNPHAPLEGLFEDQHSAIDQGIEQFQINRTLRRYLGKFETSTLAARTCLTDDAAPTDWFYNVERAVLPIIVEHDCPKVETAPA
jgi:hypothetical protein